MTSSAVATPPVDLVLLGMPVRLELRGPAAAAAREQVCRAWAWCLAANAAAPPAAGCGPADAADAVPVVPIDTSDLVGSDTDEVAVRTVLEHVATTLTLWAIDASDPQLLLVHAAGLVDPATGHVAVCAAASGTGKSTLALTLGRHFGYLSDETVGIRPDGSVLAYPRPVLVHPPGTDAAKRSVSPAEAGLRRMSPGRVGAVLLLDRVGADPTTATDPMDSPDAEAPVVEQVPILEAVLELAGQLSHLTRMTRPLQRIAALLASVGGLRRVRYREAVDLGPVLTGLLATPPDPIPPTVGEDPEMRAAADTGGESRGIPAADELSEATRVGWAPDLLDRIEADGESVVLAGGQLIWLSALPTTLVRHAAGPGASLEELTTAVVAGFGPPPDGRPAAVQVAERVHALLEAGVLVVRPSGADAEARG
ncbi:MAG TPA: hypothetical protein P5181_00740 [Dermatophilaceae bacterium]|nr:hypothetical protein [Dermatophilaceae bacterium]